MHGLGAGIEDLVLQLGVKFVHRQAGLLDEAAERAGLDRLMHRHNDSHGTPAKYGMRIGLAPRREAQANECLDGFRAVDVTRRFHATASTGS